MNRKRLALTGAIVLVSIACVLGCSPGGDSAAVTLSSPSVPSPPNGSYGVSKSLATISWAASTASDGSAVTYDLYFGEGAIPTVATVSGLSAPSCSVPVTLNEAKDYYWKVVASTAGGTSATSATWTFLASGTISDYSTRVPDTQLRSLLATAVGKSWGAITTADLDAITSFTQKNQGIASIKGLELCHELTNLNVSRNSFSDLSSLSGLAKLTSLWVQNTKKIADLSPLASLSGLEALGIGGNPIPYSNLSSVVTAAHFPNLRNLSISSHSNDGNAPGSPWTQYITAAEAVSLFARFPGLEGLSMWDFDDITAAQLASILSGRSSYLNWISLGNCNLTDSVFPSYLFGATSLTDIDVGYNTALTQAAFSSGGAYFHAGKGDIVNLALDGDTGITDLTFLKGMYDAGSFAAGAAISIADNATNTGTTDNQAIITYLQGAGLSVSY